MFPRPKAVSILLLVLLCLTRHLGFSFRVYDLSELDQLNASHAYFEPYVKGFVGYYGNPENFKRERVNEGASNTAEIPRQWSAPRTLQNCTNMVGPFQGNSYYCRGREYGFCDRRSGSCFCNVGYEGVDCSECTPTHYRKGSLCYPKKICPNDCSGAGVCSYETGLCTCFQYRKGDDCSELSCQVFESKCKSCTETQCLSCKEGYYLSSSKKCDTCLECSDAILWSIRRSGKRNDDPDLPFDELQREFSYEYPFGSQDAQVFAETENFQVLPPKSGHVPLKDHAQSCAQGLNGDISWKCTPFPISNVICGHHGTVSFSSPTYHVIESQHHLRLKIRRTGGGVGTVRVRYDIEHLTTSSSDVAPTAYYTTSQVLEFQPGVVEVSFLVTILDDYHAESNERFMVHLSDVTDGAVLGPQKMTIVTIEDDDSNLTDPCLCQVVDLQSTLMKGGVVGVPHTFQIQAMTGLNEKLSVGGEIFLVETRHALDYNDIEEMEFLDDVEQISTGSTQRGTVKDEGNGLYEVTWSRPDAGNYSVSIRQVRSGGLFGEYFANAWLENPPCITRIDHVLNFTWSTGAVIAKKASDFVSVRWTGMLRHSQTETIQIRLLVDDQVRFWVDNVLVLDQWDYQRDKNSVPPAAFITEIDAIGDKFYDVVIEYRELTKEATLKVEWRSESIGAEFVAIPSTSLFTAFHIKHSPMLGIVLQPSSLDISNSLPYGKTLSHTVAGHYTTFYVYPRDLYGNGIKFDTMNKHEFIAELTLTQNDGQGLGSPVLNGTIHWHDDRKRFNVSYQPTISGIYSLDIRDMSGAKLKSGLLQVQVDATKTFGTQCRVSGEGITTGRIAGVRTAVTIESRDTYGNLRKRAGEEHFEISAYHPEKQIVDRGTITDLGDGLYRAEYTPRFSGLYHVILALDGVYLHDSPYSVEVRANVATGSTCIGSGTGLVTASTGVQATFKVQSRDLHENDVMVGGSTCEIQLMYLPPKNSASMEVISTTVTGVCTDLGDGKYEASYTATKIGTHELHVKINGQHIRHSPFEIQVTAGPTVGNMCSAIGLGLSKGQAGFPSVFNVTVKDAYGNVKGTGKEDNVQVQITSSGGHVPPTTVTALGTGVYLVQYVPHVAGTDTIQIVVDGKELSTSPFTALIMPGVLAADQSTLYIENNVEGKTFVAGKRVGVKIQSKDAFGNNLDTSGYSFLFHFDSHPTINEFVSTDYHPFKLPEIQYAENGIYDVKLDPSIAGEYYIRVQALIKGSIYGTYYGSPDFQEPVQLKRYDASIDFSFGEKPAVHTPNDDRFSVRWEGYLVPEYTELYIFELKLDYKAKVTLNDTIVMDGTTDLNPTKPTILSASLRMPKGTFVPITVDYVSNFGTSFVQLSWQSASQRKEVIPSISYYTARNIKLDFENPIVIVPDVSHPSTFTAYGKNLTRTVAGVPTTFLVTSRDKYKNQLLSGGQYVHVFFQGHTDSHIKPSIKDLKNGLYEVSYTPQVSGLFAMTVASTTTFVDYAIGSHELRSKLDPLNIQGSPFYVKISPAGISPSKSFVMGDGAVHSTAGYKSKFTVALRDSYLNKITDGAAQFVNDGSFVARLAGPVFVPVEVFSTEDHPASVIGTYNANRTGQYTVEFSVNSGKTFVPTVNRPQVSPAIPSFNHCLYTGTGISGTVKVGTMQSFTLKARDEFENDLVEGGTPISVFLNGPETLRGNVEDLGDGTYRITYTISKKGAYEIKSNILRDYSVSDEMGGNGLVGQYFAQGKLFGATPSFITLDRTISFNWKENIKRREFRSIRWSGFVKPNFSEVFALEVNVDAQVKLYVDMDMVLNETNPGQYSIKISLKKDFLHEIVLEYTQGEKPGYIHLYWSSDRTQRELIPYTALFPSGREIIPRQYVTAE